MCQQHQSDQQDHCSQHGSRDLAAAGNEPFPWHLPVYDAHCHPTDTMDSITSLDTMRTSALAIMATRSQDQHLVAEVASLHGVQDCASLRGRRGERFHQNARGPGDDASSQDAANVPLVVQRKCQVVPSFGWHPWFSHQMYDDAASVPTYNAPPREDAAADEAALLSAKRAHYQSVLAPAPQEDGFIASLPTPTPVSSFVSSTRAKLESYPIALVGEIGLDKAFRLPESWDHSLAASRDDHGLTPGGRERRRLSPYKVQMRHQQTMLRVQLHLAGEVGRPVSVHGVQAHGVLYDTVSSCWKGHEKHVLSRRERRNTAPGAEHDDSDNEDFAHDGGDGGKPYPPRICLHSYSGPVEGLKQWLRPNIPAKIYFSFSAAVNLGTEATRAKFDQVVKAVPAENLLVESDLHVAGEDMEAALETMYRRVCGAKGWSLEEGVRTIGKNFEDFIFG